MLDSNADIARFLTGVLRTRNRLHDVYNHYVRRRNKVHCGTSLTGPIWAESGYIEYGLMVTGSDSKNYELSARLRWPGEKWIVEAEAAMEEEDAEGNWLYPTLRDLAKKESEDWEQALGDFSLAVASLKLFDDLIPAGS